MEPWKDVLCYGDSNTWGYNQTGAVSGRAGLAAACCSGYYVIEEGLNGRTTAFDDHIEPFRNGRKVLDVCCSRTSPWICLYGTNDTAVSWRDAFRRAPAIGFIDGGGQSGIRPAGQPPKYCWYRRRRRLKLNDYIRNYVDETSAKKLRARP